MSEKNVEKALEEMVGAKEPEKKTVQKRNTKKANVKKAEPENSEDALLKRTKPKKFINDGSKVFTQKASTKLANEIKKVDKTMQKLIFAYQSQTYLTAKMSGVRHSKKHGLCALCYYSADDRIDSVYQILIPFEKFAEITDEELAEKKITKDIYLERRIGSTIDFIPEEYEKDRDTYLFIGNRIDAMKLSCYEHWFAIEKNGMESKQKFNIGSHIEARVVGKYPRAGIRVEIFGVEATIPIDELSYIHIPTDLSTLKFDVGDDIEVVITRLKREQNPMNVEFSASLKQIAPDPRLIAYDRIEVGDSMQGVVSGMLFKEDDLANCRIFIVLDGGGEAMCARFDHEQVKVGDKVSVRVGNKYVTNEGEPRIEVLIKHVFKH